MWPFKHKKPIRCETTSLIAFERALKETRELIRQLDSGAAVVDDRVRKAYFELANGFHSNCNNVAIGLLETIGALCAHKHHLAREFLPSALRPVYYLGIEDWNGVRGTILNVSRMKRTNLDTLTPRGRIYLKRISEDRQLFVDSFREMYNAEDNEWRNADEQVPKMPPILMAMDSKL